MENSVIFQYGKIKDDGRYYGIILTVMFPCKYFIGPYRIEKGNEIVIDQHDTIYLWAKTEEQAYEKLDKLSNQNNFYKMV